MSACASRARAPGASALVLRRRSCVVVALFGPFFAPHSPDRAGRRCRCTGPSSDALLGTDFLGRDVLSRVLWGGR